MNKKELRLHGNRFIFCIPITGLNDTFNQIERCWKHAERYNRTLVIDTRISGLNCDFWELFDIKNCFPDNEIAGPFFDIVDRAKYLTTRPIGLSGNPAPLRSEITYSENADRLIETGESLRLNLEIDYPEQVLVHVSRGGGNESHKLLDKVQLNTSTRNEVVGRLKHLPQSYVAAHVRNTDATSNYMDFFKKNRSFFEHKNVLICSDDQTVVDFAAEYLRRSTVFTTGVTRSRDGQPLHAGESAILRGREQAVEALVDLIALSQSTELKFPRVKHGLGDTPVKKMKNLVNVAIGRRSLSRLSGFTSLASYLHENDQVLRSFLGDTETS